MVVQCTFGREKFQKCNIGYYWILFGRLRIGKCQQQQKQSRIIENPRMMKTKICAIIAYTRSSIECIVHSRSSIQERFLKIMKLFCLSFRSSIAKWADIWMFQESTSPFTSHLAPAWSWFVDLRQLAEQWRALEPIHWNVNKHIVFETHWGNIQAN